MFRFDKHFINDDCVSLKLQSSLPGLLFIITVLFIITLKGNLLNLTDYIDQIMHEQNVSGGARYEKRWRIKTDFIVILVR